MPEKNKLPFPSTTTYQCRMCDCSIGTQVVTGLRDWEYGTPGEWAYMCCNECGMVQLHPFPGIEELKLAYGTEYEPFVYSHRSGQVFSLLKHFVEAACRRRLRSVARPGQRVLDVGCGEGEMLDRLASIGAFPQGLDFSEQAVKLCRVRGFDIFHGTFEDYVSSGQSSGFDVVLMKDYLEHTIDPRGDLYRARQVLNPGGRLMITIPNYGAFDRMLFGRYWGGNHTPRHTFQYTPATLAALLEDAGFAVIGVRPDPSPTCFALSVQNFLERSAVLAGRKPAIRGGRSRYYTTLLLLFAPLHLLLMTTRRVGIITVTAALRPKAGAN